MRPGHADAVARLEALADRIAADRLNIAVVGQFKRGKSTLLNALLGEALLPVAAVPATAIATFISGGPSREVTLTFASGRTEDRSFDHSAALAACLAEVVTEGGNPCNVLGLARVDVVVPSPFLSEGAVLVDTPGIGSTHLHNSDTARSTLSACDAALLVLSADLPITEAEAAFVREVQAAAAALIVVVTKADVASDEDLAAIVEFSRSRLAEILGLNSGLRVSIVSAKEGLKAKLCGDAVGLVRSGLPALEQLVAAVAEHGRRGLLAASVAGGASRTVAHLTARLRLHLAALRLPLEDLDRRSELIEEAAAACDWERKTCQDLLAGDWKRSIERLDAACEAIDRRARATLRPTLEEAVLRAATEQAARGQVASAIAAFFDEAKAEIVAGTRQDVEGATALHRARLARIIDRIEASTAEIMQVSQAKRPGDEEQPPMREPYWVYSGRIDTLGSLTVDGLAALLPRPLKEARRRRLLLAGIDGAIVRNLSSLQWAVRQTLDDTYRRLGPQLDAEIDASLTATRQALGDARQLRASHADELHSEQGILGSAAEELEQIEVELQWFAARTEGAATDPERSGRTTSENMPSLRHEQCDANPPEPPSEWDGHMAEDLPAGGTLIGGRSHCPRRKHDVNQMGDYQ